MGFLGIQKPFQKESVDNYQGVLVPLANANRHPSVAAEYARRRSTEGRSSDGAVDTVKRDKEASAEDGRNPSDEFSPYTIEGLRAEVTHELSAGAHDTSYDCMYFDVPKRCGRALATEYLTGVLLVPLCLVG